MAQIQGVVQTLVASAARTATGNSGALSLTLEPDAAMIAVDVTVASASDTLDIYVQTSHDGGTTWTDFMHFTQLVAVIKKIMAWSSKPDGNQNRADLTSGAAVLAAATVLNGPIVPTQVRVAWVITGTSPSFTFEVYAIMQRSH